ncbi:hypothetical protein [Roseobacter fucihabitans]|uniref:hypothetical protein n=1 Tax=Roseobacter fucihabitans TaxID=1537242 RepID=UPI001652F989|nr:hypothetical protein [Roseobacter litoralis]
MLQREYDGVKKLRIGVIYAGNTVPIFANQIPAQTYVWVLSNDMVGARELEGVTSGQNKSSPNEIITANKTNVAASKKQDENRSGGEVVGRVFQSGPFHIPRNGDVGGDRNKLDYSFWRFAALKSYGIWYASSEAAAKGWPDITSNKTLVETIDSDVPGMTGTTNAGKVTDDNPKEMKTDWLAVAGLYRWDWQDVKDHPTLHRLFGDKHATRDTALRAFSDQYTEAEGDARAAASSDIFKIYFPEPATRLSGPAITLLTTSGLGDMAVSAGTQIGHKRESIGMIAALVRLDVTKNTGSQSASKGKLSFNRSFETTTGLGKRDGAYASLFAQWYDKAKTPTEKLNKIDFATLSRAKEFDQSYLNDALAGNVLKWHNETYDAMSDDDSTKKRFFNPK